MTHYVTWGLVIGSVDKIACSRGQQTNLTEWSTPLMRCLTLSSKITCLRREAWVCTIPHHERDLFWSISPIPETLELWILQWTCILMGQTKVAQRGCDPGMLKWPNTRRMMVHSKKWTSISIIYRYSSNQWISLHTTEEILRIRWSEAEQ